MVKPRVDKLMERTDSHYAAVIVAAKRARQLNSYYRALGEGTYEEHTPPMVEVGSENYLTIALEEVAADAAAEQVVNREAGVRHLRQRLRQEAGLDALGQLQFLVDLLVRLLQPLVDAVDLGGFLGQAVVDLVNA